MVFADPANYAAVSSDEEENEVDEVAIMAVQTRNDVEQLQSKNGLLEIEVNKLMQKTSSAEQAIEQLHQFYSELRG